MTMSSNQHTSLHSNTDTINDADSNMSVIIDDFTESSSTSTGEYTGLLLLCWQW